MSRADVGAWVLDRLAALLATGAEKIDLDKSIYDYGLESVDAVILAGEFEEAFAVEVDPGAFVQSPTLRGVIAGLQEALDGGGAPDVGEEFFTERSSTDEAAQQSCE